MSLSEKIVTRFAPSPTGSLHVGGARTALFNWALARRHGGKFILRIEDTDQTRSTNDATRGILADLKWLGLDWDEGPAPPPDRGDDAYLEHQPYEAPQHGDAGPYFQSQRLEQGVYRPYLDQLIAAGRAYRCFKTTEQLAAERDAARREKRPYRYDPTEALSRSREEADRLASAGQPFVIRFHMPEQDQAIDDLVLGEVRFAADQQEDFVIFKADGFPTYHFAVVVDDAAMGVTHVVRGQEHLNNTAKHIALQDALGLDRPRYAHIPLIFNADGSKMSKRDKAKAAREAARTYIKTNDLSKEAFAEQCAVKLRRLEAEPGVDAASLPGPTAEDVVENIVAFMDKKHDELTIAELIAVYLHLTLPEIEVYDFHFNGYLPGVLCNYLALLGWSPGNDIERFGPEPLAFIRDRFSLDRVVKGSARFDREKLFRFNAEAIAAMDDTAFRHAVWQLPPNHSRLITSDLFTGPDDPKFAMFCAAYQERSRTLREPIENGEFFFLDDSSITYDAKAVEKVLLKNDGDGGTALEQIRDELAALDDDAWHAERINATIKTCAERTGRGMGKVAQPLRVAVTGSTISPPIDQTLAILGKNATLNRINNCLDKARNQPA